MPPRVEPRCPRCRGEVTKARYNVVCMRCGWGQANHLPIANWPARWNSMKEWQARYMRIRRAVGWPSRPKPVMTPERRRRLWREANARYRARHTERVREFNRGYARNKRRAQGRPTMERAWTPERREAARQKALAQWRRRREGRKEEAA